MGAAAGSAPSVPAPTPTTAAATTPAAAAGSAPSVPAPTPTTAAAAGSTTPTDAAARRSSRTSKRNPDFPADHHAYWGDLPDSCTAECGAASSAQSSDDRRCRLSQNIVNHTAPFQTQLAQPVQTVQTI